MRPSTAATSSRRNWPALYKPEQGANLPAEELLRVERGADYGWPECYFDDTQQKLVLAPEYRAMAERLSASARRSAALLLSSPPTGRPMTSPSTTAVIPCALPRRRLHCVPRLVESSAIPAGRLQHRVPAARGRQAQREVRGLRRRLCRRREGAGLWGDGSLAAIGRTITQGVPQPKEHTGVMPPMGGAQLSPSEVSALAAYIAALNQRTSVERRRATMTRHLVTVLAMLGLGLPAIADAQSARAQLKDAQANVVGTATLSEVPGGVRVTLG